MSDLDNPAEGLEPQHFAYEPQEGGFELFAEALPGWDSNAVWEYASFNLLSAACECSFISKLACAEADYFKKQNAAVPEGLLLLILMLQYRLEQGDICLRLELDAAGLPGVMDLWQQAHSGRSMPARRVYAAEEYLLQRSREILAAWRRQPGALPRLLSRSPFVGTATKADRLLIYDRRRLYFRRYFLYEVNCADFIKKRRALPYYTQQRDFMRLALQLLFPHSGRTVAEVNWQQTAAALACLNNFTIISGGPGTGKTTTVIRLLLLLLVLDRSRRVIALAAPTGKAAARMAEAIAGQLSLHQQELGEAAALLCREAGLDPDLNLLDLIPREAQTVHRLLKVRPHQVSISYDAKHPLPADIVVIDEVSMVDLSLFNKLLQALGPNTILILLGDKDQLCSVEAGSVLGDLAFCLQQTGGRSPYLGAETAEKLSWLCAEDQERILQGSLSDFALLLQKSYRFKADSGIGRLARLVNDLPAVPDPRLLQRKREGLQQILKSCRDLKYERFAPAGPALRDYIGRLVQDCVHGRAEAAGEAEFGFGSFLKFLRERDFILSDEEAQQAFALMDRFRVLCSNRLGYTGDRNLNLLIEEAVLSSLHSRPVNAQGDFAGRIVLITRNDPIVGVTNGDVGFEAYERRPDGSCGELRVFLPGNSGKENQVKKISPLFLNSYESGFAMTVHKSQGSEYDHVLFVTAQRDNPVLTKELVYTAVTRAKKAVTIAGSARRGEDGRWYDEVLLSACLKRVQRQSGLISRLYDTQLL